MPRNIAWDTELDVAYTAAQMADKGTQLGDIREEAGRQYQFVYVDDDVDVVVGSVLIAADDTVSDHAVTPDIAGGSSIVYAGTNTNMFIHHGIAMAACDVSEGYRYIWSQVKGRNAVAIVTDTNVVVGRGIVAVSDGTAGLDTLETDADPMTNIHRVLGFAADADSGSSLAIGDCILDGLFV